MKRALVATALTVLVASACSSEPPQLAGYVRAPAPNSADIALPDAGAGGASFHLKADAGELLLVYFGFTACPDVCPTTLADIRTALRDLGDLADGVELAMVTVDPMRDTADVLVGYVQSFVPDARGLRTEDDALLSDAAYVLGAGYQVEENDEGEIEVLHTAHIYVIDENGDLLVTWPFGIAPDDMTSDLRILFDQK